MISEIYSMSKEKNILNDIGSVAFYILLRVTYIYVCQRTTGGATTLLLKDKIETKHTSENFN